MLPFYIYDLLAWRDAKKEGTVPGVAQGAGTACCCMP